MISWTKVKQLSMWTVSDLVKISYLNTNALPLLLLLLLLSPILLLLLLLLLFFIYWPDWTSSLFCQFWIEAKWYLDLRLFQQAWIECKARFDSDYFGNYKKTNRQWPGWATLGGTGEAFVFFILKCCNVKVLYPLKAYFECRREEVRGKGEE